MPQVLECLSAAGIYLNPKKFRFHVQDVDYLGFEGFDETATVARELEKLKQSNRDYSRLGRPPRPLPRSFLGVVEMGLRTSWAQIHPRIRPPLQTAHKDVPGCFSQLLGGHAMIAFAQGGG